MADSGPLFELTFRPAPPPPPPTLVIKRNDGRVPLVMSEDEALELYVVLKGHFEKETPGEG